MEYIVNAISVIAAFVLVFGILCIVQSYTLGLLSLFKRKISKRFALGDIIFPLNSLLLIIFFVEFGTPY
ncbi:hypothetical protein [Exiguobacterium acetylicum]|uniref:hypothetical protein n=1 Tax=Exiguobacterium acetylicum TaxID=41170 RepID=UPI003017D96D